ncbi:ABC transporter substrate-binding protein [Alicyclobacillus mengziensis]|uniref:Extracellular solute-binding protein n=1 Tax=Alicyclobacillus mengziensis TaxID=2931921 RepID=A0A9X7W2A3_9BACL|nr:extracellular solute-binding protein [Alicyclobacillus mengziensis]QSO49329.1 extracellular solute-binding protein [Alicyclobacillus mengziensis]
MRKKYRFLAGSTVVALLTVTACGTANTGTGGASSNNSTSAGNAGNNVSASSSTANANTSAPSTSSSNGGVPAPQWPAYNKHATITWWTWLSTAPQYAAEFEKVYPSIKINVVNVGANGTEYKKLMTALKAGSGAPDLAFLEYDVVPEFIQTGGLVNLNKYIGFVKPYYQPWTINEVSVGSNMYAVPQDIGPMVLDYNQNLLKSAGLTPPTTWSQLASDAKLYHQKTGKYYTYFDEGDGKWLVALLWQAGITPWSGSGNNWKINIDTPQAQKVMNYWGSLLKSGAVIPSESLTPTWNSQIAKGDFAVAVGAAWFADFGIKPALNTTSSPWRVASIPQWNPANPTNGDFGGSSNAVTTQSKHPMAAALFAAWYTSSVQGLAKLANPPAGYGAATYADKYEGKTAAINTPDPFLGGQKPTGIYEQDAKLVNTSFQWTPWSSYIFNEFGVEMTKAAQGSESFDQALANIQSSVVNYAKSQGYQVSQ